ncbi:uncharacterized protein DS421_20g695330 [Arachis hypogaea]|nr:uncharacterized protein DS421_20g695330 [Arachis hypogaea]
MLPLYFTRHRRARRRGAVSASLPFEGLCLAAVVPPCFTVTELCRSLLFGLVMLLRKLLQEEEQAESPCFGPPGVVMWLPGSPPELRAELLPLETLLPLCSTAGKSFEFGFCSFEILERLLMPCDCNSCRHRDFYSRLSLGVTDGAAAGLIWKCGCFVLLIQ